MASAARSALSCFKRTRASCWRNIRCAEVRPVGVAPPRFLGPRFCGGNEGRARRNRKSAEGQSGGELSHRLPGERRDPGATELWMATKRASNRHGLRSTERAVLFQKNPSIVLAEYPLR